jgi:ribosomal protein L37E
VCFGTPNKSTPTRQQQLILQCRRCPTYSYEMRETD